MLFWILLLLLTTVFLYYHFFFKKLQLPGPTPLPFLGNVLDLNRVKRYEFRFIQWAKQFGPIYTYWIGELPVVAVCEAQLAKKMFITNGEDYVGRQKTASFQRFLRDKPNAGVIFVDGQRWRDARRFILKTFRNFGLNKNQMQERVDEIQTIIVNIRADIDRNVDEHDFHRHTDIAVGSVINNLVLGFRFTQDGREQEFYHYKELTTSIIRCLTQPIVVIARFNDLFFKLTRRYLAHLYRPFEEMFDRMFVDELNKKDLDEHAEPRDFVDAFLLEKLKLERENAPNAAFYTIDQLVGICFDIWFAGQETTSTTLTWTIAFLICNPDVQAKLHAELDAMIGSDRLVMMADRSDLPYTNAVIMEAQRTANIISQNVFRTTTKDVEVEGYRIPKGTCCIAQISALQYDPKVFPNPEQFRPERFIDEKGHLKHYDEFIPFGLGKRSCLGLGLANMELFLFITNLFNQFEFLSGNIAPVCEKWPTSGSTACKPYRCRLRKRFQPQTCSS
ncbi:(pine wood nematode) hypothetical protein [Aphelenchoides besseyi]|nr:(pine wood nematode) hypothetical protein [Aphelenchoides besseyi]